MKTWRRRIGRTAMMGLAWAAAWVPVGSLAGWLMVGELEPEWIGGPLYTGFLCGAMFSAVAGLQTAVADSLRCHFRGLAPGGR